MGADGIARRLAHLEATTPTPCDECGHAPGAPIAGFEVEWADEPGDGPEFCPTCGQQLVYVLRWADDNKGGNAV